jgi:glycosyltransferase involved in cell wall biosynthesis
MISIITICFNAESTILSALQSVKDQEIDFPFEHLIIDGASTDRTLGIIEANKEPFTRVISEKDTGLYNALNKGVQQAKGDIIGVLHADDFLSHGSILKEIIQQFEEKNIDGLYGDLDYVSADNPKKVIRKWRSKPFKRKNLHFGWMPAHPTLFLRKEIYAKHGDFDESFKIAADYDFMLRILKDTTLRFHYYPEIITHMRLGGASSATANLRRKMAEDLRAMRRNALPFPLFTLFCKNFRKLTQFF